MKNPTARVVLSLILAASLSACLTTRRPGPADKPYATTGALHTDRIAESRIELLSQDAHSRVVHIRSVPTPGSGESSRVLTTAVTLFATARSAAVDPVHRAIVGGGSIGKSFVAAGFEVRKNIVHLEELPLSAWLQRALGTSRPRALMRVYEFWVRKPGTLPEPYAVIAEVYPPPAGDSPLLTARDQDQLGRTFADWQQGGGDEESLWQTLSRGRPLRFERDSKAIPARTAELDRRLTVIRSLIDTAVR